MRNNTEALDSIEQLAIQILKEVSAVRAGNTRMPGESSGMWRVRQLVPR
jgi:hypothetical protein